MEQDRRRFGNKKNCEWKFAWFLKENWICCGTATPCLAYFLKSRVVDQEKKECRQIEIVARAKTSFTRIETIIEHSEICCYFLFRKLLKRHPIHFWSVSVSRLHYFLIWNVYYDVLGTLILPIKGWDVFFFPFLEWKIASFGYNSLWVAKVSALAGSRLLFWTLVFCPQVSLSFYFRCPLINNLKQRKIPFFIDLIQYCYVLVA